MNVVGALTVLLVCQTIGEALARYFELPVPGPVIGLALLFAVLVARGRPPEGLADTANGLLKHLSLLFVPAGVGVMLHMDRIGAEWLPIAAALAGSTVITIGVTALAMQAVMNGRSAERK
jgi:holin-like protein